jgi:hypothetical protein
VIGKAFACVIAVVGSAALTLTTMIALVQGTIVTLSIDNLSLRVLAVVLDVFFGTALLLACIYVATHLAVLILGVGQTEFPPLPQDTSQTEPSKN